MTAHLPLGRRHHRMRRIGRCGLRLAAAVAACMLLACGGGGGGGAGAGDPGPVARPSNPWMDPANIVAYKPEGADWDALIRALGKTEQVRQIDRLDGRPIYLLQVTHPSQQQDVLDALNGQGCPGCVAEANAEVWAPEYRADAFELDAILNSVIAIWTGEEDTSGGSSVWADARLRIGDIVSPVQEPVTVAVLDTGVDRQHSVLRNKTLAGRDFVDPDEDPGETGCPDSPTLGDACGHGTHVAGTLVKAAAPARILPARVLDRRGVGTLWTLARGMVWALDPNADRGYRDGARVMNLSLGVDKPHDVLGMLVELTTCGEALRASTDRYADPGFDVDRGRCSSVGGAVIVAGTGNNARSEPLYPAQYEARGLIAVTASTEGDGLATFSSRGAVGEIAAPGVWIVGPFPGENRYASMAGTSMAAPWVSASAALMLAGRTPVPGLNGVVVDLLRSTARTMAGEPTAREVDPVSAVAAAPPCDRCR